MKARDAVSKYASEAEMCLQFAGYAATQGWVAYAEIEADFDQWAPPL